NQINNVRFTNEHADQIKENLIKEAVHNGQRAAQAAAEAAGSQLGAVKEINISGTSPSYNRVYAAGMSLRAVKMEAADSTPVEAGTNTLSQSVNLTYYLQ
ncbi:MAG: SIMPL domain-containing protein, partial [Megasphaera elsdenii]|nr:SIMPL domain-containing protein [Megasphaera elsdenii]